MTRKRREIWNGYGISSLIKWLLEPQTRDHDGHLAPRIFQFTTPSDGNFPGAVEVILTEIGHGDVSGQRFYIEGKIVSPQKYRNRPFEGYYDFSCSRGWMESDI